LQLPFLNGIIGTQLPFFNGIGAHQELMGLMEDMSHEHEAATGSRWDRFLGFTGWVTGMG
jgi:hypothetical protein